MLYQLRFTALDKSQDEARTVRKSALVFAESLTESIASLTSVITSKAELFLDLQSVDSSSKSRVSKVYFNPEDEGDFYRTRVLIQSENERNTQDFIIVQADSLAKATEKAEEIFESQGVKATATTGVKLDQLLLPELIQDAGEVLS